ncbi:hypothetical protein PEDI_53130 [Persicobacter diffluens]|uniref:Uncharacterized protein n=1 Tax=Persicobacter diffluens TaxID=981 RepID=A0AAN4W320_9BACT|nr:hypothetical protein PEDI_53130 [Persicobacter diffluens]
MLVQLQGGKNEGIVPFFIFSKKVDAWGESKLAQILATKKLGWLIL